MNNKNILSGVSDTLFIPLTARVEVSRRFPEYFFDAKSMELMHCEAVERIRKSSSEYSMLASVARYYNMDRIAAEFIAKHKKCAIVNLGVGLETMNYRLKDTDAHFYNVDFADVIDSRKKLLGTAENETMIGCDITDLVWVQQVDTSLPVLMIVSGVFQYFQPEAVNQLLTALKEALPGAELVFDATNEVGINYARKYVKKTGNTSAMMYFYINVPQQFANTVGVTLLGVHHFYDDARTLLKRRLNLYTRIAMKIADEKNRTLLLHIKLCDSV